jgi:hemolysin-activating ACP:hemolysin acyltransferase
MNASHDIGIDPAQFLKSLDPSFVGAAQSKLVAASIGDIVVVLSRSSAHKHYSLADIEWMVMPPVIAGQFYVAEAADKERGFRAPVAVVTWAFVSEEVDQLLQEQAAPLRRLRPDEWKNGVIGWLIDAAGDSVGVRTALQWLAAGPFKEQPLKMTVRGEGETAKVTTLGALLTEAAEATSTTECR